MTTTEQELSEARADLREANLQVAEVELAVALAEENKRLLVDCLRMLDELTTEMTVAAKDGRLEMFRELFELFEEASFCERDIMRVSVLDKTEDELNVIRGTLNCLGEQLVNIQQQRVDLAEGLLEYLKSNQRKEPAA